MLVSLFSPQQDNSLLPIALFVSVWRGVEVRSTNRWSITIVILASSFFMVTQRKYLVLLGRRAKKHFLCSPFQGSSLLFDSVMLESNGTFVWDIPDLRPGGAESGMEE